VPDHRGRSAREIPVTARLLAAADTYQAMTQPRPHRAPLPVDAAAAAVHEEAVKGRIDPDAVRCVLQAAGRRPLPLARALPAGLTVRELAVLRLLAAGCSNQEIADRLVISRRTAERHAQHIYTRSASPRAPRSRCSRCSTISWCSPRRDRRLTWLRRRSLAGAVERATRERAGECAVA
jgi:DNA-binding CsgD family transcriptional regulator